MEGWTTHVHFSITPTLPTPDPTFCSSLLVMTCVLWWPSLNLHPCCHCCVDCLSVHAWRTPLLPAAAYDKVVLALMADPEVTEDLVSVISAGAAP
jgi:hypothetical protein